MLNVIVTGAGKGIGKAIVLELAQLGCKFCVNARTQNDLEILKKEIDQSETTSSISYKTCDVSKVQEVKDFADFAFEKLDSVDLLINNAGVFIPGAIQSEDEQNLKTMMETNLYSAYHLSRAVIPHMKKRKYGQIINICSIASIKAYENGGSYAISKFALLGMTRCLREELKNDGIRVNAILPGATWTNSWSGANFPQERLMHSRDIAKVVRNCIELSPNAVIEDVIIRPILGDL